tara:strand:- start:694 stop:1449 length:756 start_codon:yes stop_codon:yes gene_type:complete
MGYFGNQPAESALTTGDLGDDIVTLAKIQSGTDGELLTWDSSGNPTTVSVGSSGHYLKSQGAGSVPVFAAVADPTLDYEYVSSATQDSGSAHIEFTNMADGFDYVYVIIDVQCTTLYADFEALLGTNSSTYRTSNYVGQGIHISHSGSVASGEETDSITLVNDASEGMGTATDTGVKCGEVTLYNPANASDQTAWRHDCTHLGGTPQVKHEFGGGYYSTAEAHTCVKFRCFQGGSARTTTGSILQFRRKRS